MKERLIELLCNVHCKGEEDSRSCAARRAGACRVIERLDMCMLTAIAEHLLAAGVLVPPAEEVEGDA